jgi:hypothetical protein
VTGQTLLNHLYDPLDLSNSDQAASLQSSQVPVALGDTSSHDHRLSLRLGLGNQVGDPLLGRIFYRAAI